MKNAWRIRVPVMAIALALPVLLLVPITVVAEEAVIPPPAQESGVAVEGNAVPAVTEATSPAESTKARPTLVEKLKAQEAAAPRNPAPAWGNMIFGLAAVLGLILGLAWLSKRLRMRVPGMADQMKIVEAISLGPREKLCVVLVDGKRLLLGVTQHSITVLQSADDDSKKEESEAMFSEKIKRMLQNGTSNGR